jgi:hypothetical protein
VIEEKLREVAQVLAIDFLLGAVDLEHGDAAIAI